MNYEELKKELEKPLELWERIYYPIYRFCLYLDWRWIKWFFQFMKRGFSDRQVWSLDYTIAKFILPRLKRFRDTEAIISIPCSLGLSFSHRVNYYDENDKSKEKEKFDANVVAWQAIIDDMIFAFECVVNDDEYLLIRSEEERDEREKRIKRGLALFAKYFNDLWG